MKEGTNSKENRILTYVQKNHQITTQQAMELTGGSESTVRRVFNKLHEKGYVIRTYGGIRSLQARETYKFLVYFLNFPEFTGFPAHQHLCNLRFSLIFSLVRKL